MKTESEMHDTKGKWEIFTKRSGHHSAWYVYKYNKSPGWEMYEVYEVASKHVAGELSIKLNYLEEKLEELRVLKINQKSS